MSPHPFRLLTCAYGLSAILGVVLAREAGWLVGGLAFWALGAVFVFVLGMTPGLRGYFRDETRDHSGQDVAVMQDMDAWERDRRADSASAEAQDRARRQAT